MWPDSPREALAWTRATPWKAWAELRRLAAWPWVRLYFARHGVPVGEGWRIYGRPRLQRHRHSRMVFGDRLELRNWWHANPLGIDHPCLLTTWAPNALLQLGNSVGISGGILCAGQLVQLGDRVTVGANCTIMDTDFHPLEPGERAASPLSGATSPVVIEDDVFIGTQSLILKGSRIGRGAVIGAGSVVRGDVPAGAIAAGNPAQIIGHL